MIGRIAGRVLLGCSGFLIPFAGTGFADAAVHHPPRVTLHDGNRLQRGNLWRSTWGSATGSDACGIGIRRGRPTFGPAFHVGAGRQITRIRFHKSLRPRQKPIIKAWTAIDADGHPKGGSELLSSRLVRERRNGHLRWVSVIDPLVTSDLYINISAGWDDPKSCSAVNNGSWTFHIAP